MSFIAIEPLKMMIFRPRPLAMFFFSRKRCAVNDPGLAASKSGAIRVAQAVPAILRGQGPVQNWYSGLKWPENDGHGHGDQEKSNRGLKHPQISSHVWVVDYRTCREKLSNNMYQIINILIFWGTRLRKHRGYDEIRWHAQPPWQLQWPTLQELATSTRDFTTRNPHALQ